MKYAIFFFLTALMPKTNKKIEELKYEKKQI